MEYSFYPFRSYMSVYFGAYKPPPALQTTEAPRLDPSKDKKKKSYADVDSGLIYRRLIYITNFNSDFNTDLNCELESPPTFSEVKRKLSWRPQ